MLSLCLFSSAAARCSRSQSLDCEQTRESLAGYTRITAFLSFPKELSLPLPNAFFISTPTRYIQRMVIAINTTKIAEKSDKFKFAVVASFLLAIDFMAYYYYGTRVFIITAISVATSVLTDYICCSAMKRRFDWSDQSPVMEGLLLALLMPASVPYSIVVIASVFMTVVGKYAFGGNRNLIFSPVALAYAFCSFTWSNIIVRYPMPKPFGEVSLASTVTDTLAHSFTYNFDHGASGTFSMLDMLWGKLAGPMGTSCVLIILICAISLYFFGNISKTVFFTGVAANVLLFVLFPENASGWQAVCYSFVTGSYMFVLVFMACDHRFVPKYELSRFIYALIVAVMAFVFRRFTTIENGAVFSLLLANIFKDELDRLSKALLELLDKTNIYLEKKHLEYKQRREERALAKADSNETEDVINAEASAIDEVSQNEVNTEVQINE